MRTKYCITFAGVPGSSKSPIANHLSWNLGIPIFNNDTLRTEVKEDLLKFDQKEYKKRRDERAINLMDSGKSFIYDASVDRMWETHHRRLEGRGYEVFIISLNLSESLLSGIYKAKNYTEFAHLDLRQPEHDKFLEEFGHLVNLHIDDEGFPRRLELSLGAVKAWIG
ncbi:MAG TPA: hypothetical protein PKC86_02105 [Candidatus Saccharibacteria bacterium]|nr:hypothetical protein [Candidatus Saccharibacteria bacterium]